MAFTVIVKQGAVQDAIEAYNYYEAKQSGLGEKFVESLIKRYKELAENPTFYSYIAEDTTKTFRDVRLVKFPYLIVYEIYSDQVIVHAIHNTHKHPENKFKKIRE
jgi:plasmid stabilization system protein ParE